MISFKGKNILVTGGAGYIGSHVLKQLGETGASITIVDNLSTGRKQSLLAGRLVVADCRNARQIDSVFKQGKFDAVIHFAGSIQVAESVVDPLKYYENNTCGSLNIIQAAIDYEVDHFIFSSTAAVYGIPEEGACTESAPLAPINPYGESKKMTEDVLRDVTAAHPDFRYVALRYFNVAGADYEAKLGQYIKNATHLIKIACQVATGQREGMSIFGDDYDTPDGTCIRDYIHVLDLAHAHILALKYLFDGGESEVMNCGYSQGYSVKEVLDTVQEVTGKTLNVSMAERRDGDPPMLIAKADKIKEKLGWVPQHNNLKEIIRSAYEFERGLGA